MKQAIRTLAVGLLTSLGLTMITLGASGRNHEVMSYLEEGQTPVAVLYTTICPECGYDKCEGDYSIVVNYGTENCPECRFYTTYSK